MGSAERLAQALGALRLYRLTGESLVERELQSYEAGFSLVEEALEEILTAGFIQSCDGAQLGRWERLLRVPDGGSLPERNRRDILLAKLAIRPTDQSVEGIRTSLRAVGLETRVEENPPLGNVVLRDGEITGEYPSLDALKRQVYAMMPAHLEADFDIGILTWGMFDGKDLSFAALDERDFTWEWWELNGEKL